MVRNYWDRARRAHGSLPIRVEFYTRDGCCLCDDALRVLERAGRQYKIDLQVINVDQSADLQQRFGSLVPVVLVNGRERFHGRVNQVLLSRLLSSEAS